MSGPDEFATNLREARRRAGFSRRELAERSGLSEAGILYLEKGRRCPELVSIHLLARALSVKPGELIEGLRR